MHIPVLLDEAIELLNIQKNGIYVDATVGYGGHSSEILKKISNNNGHLYCFDQDINALKFSEDKLKKISNNFTLFHENFINLTSCLAIKNVFEVDGILFDLGVSSPQFDNSKRGFSYKLDSRLDMRMDQSKKIDAYYVINNFSQAKLSKIFKEYGEEKFSNKIAAKIVEQREIKPIDTTIQLVDIIKQVLPKSLLYQKKHPARKIFQALRIYVNDELNIIEDTLEQAVKLLKKDGRLVVITFHSLEERVVKKVFKKLTISKDDAIFAKLPIKIDCKKEYSLLIKKPICPSNQEITVNKRARSAKLWAIKKIIRS